VGPGNYVLSGGTDPPDEWAVFLGGWHSYGPLIRYVVMCRCVCVSDVMYQVRCVTLSSGRRLFCVWLTLDPQYSLNFSRSFNHADVDIVHSTPSSAVSRSTNNSAHVCITPLCIVDHLSPSVLQCISCC